MKWVFGYYSYCSYWHTWDLGLSLLKIAPLCSMKECFNTLSDYLSKESADHRIAYNADKLYFIMITMPSMAIHATTMKNIQEFYIFVVKPSYGIDN